MAKLVSFDQANSHAAAIDRADALKICSNPQVWK